MTDTIETSAVDKVSAALVACQGELKPAAFDSQNPFLHNKYASLGAIIDVSRPVLLKHGLAILQVPQCDGEWVAIETSIVHTSGQTIHCGSVRLKLGEEKGKSAAQVFGSLTTYLRRYSWSSVLGIYADSDDDGNSAPKQQAQKQPPIKATKAFALKALNNLNAAPGQSSRGLVEGFLRSKLWIRGEQTPEDWDLDHVPKSPEEMRAVAGMVAEYESVMRETPQQS